MLGHTLAIALFIFVALAPGYGTAGEKATVYKDPHCGCCSEYVTYLQRQGFDVTAVDTSNLSQIKQQHGVPAGLEGCHTVLIGGYVVEGHVPANVLNRLLAEKPAIKGVSLPGMPMGSPGMGGEKQGPFVIYGFTDNGARVYATE